MAEGRPKKIYLIEDDETFAKTLCQMLIKEGYEVTANSSADLAKGWATSKDISFDMIMSDQRLPGELGSSFLTFLSELEKTDIEKLDIQSPLYRDIRKRFSKLDENEFQKLLKGMKVHPHLRVILSGYLEEKLLKNALEAGVIHGIISKKSSREQILSQIRNLFEKASH